jgi:hypothetical protein
VILEEIKQLGKILNRAYLAYSLCVFGIAVAVVVVV